MLNIEGLDKRLVLIALYNRSRIAPMAILTGQARPDAMTIEEAEQAIENTPDLYFDYLHGRVLKVSLKGDLLDLRLYDRDNGRGAGELAILEEFCGD